MDRSRHFFQIKKRKGDRAIGDKLIMRYPERCKDAVPLLADLDKIPQSITIGYYVTLDHPPGAIAFMPLDTPQAIAMLSVPSVQARICEDLAMRRGAEE